MRRDLFGVEGGFEGVGDFGGVGFHFGIEAGEDFAVTADEEFGEVPADIAGEGGVFAGEECEEGVALGAVDVDFFEHGEADAVGAGAEFHDFGGGAGFLGAELVAGEAADDEALALVLHIKGFEGFVLGGEAAVGGDVDDEDDFAGVGLEGGGLAVDGFDGDVVEGTGGVEVGDGNHNGGQ